MISGADFGESVVGFERGRDIETGTYMSIWSPVNKSYKVSNILVGVVLVFV